MKYLLDANVFIEAVNRYYAFDLCPGFWSWLDHIVLSGKVFTIDMVMSELLRKKDQLATWAEHRKSSAWVLTETDEDTQIAFQRVNGNLSNKQYSQHAVSSFLSGADPWLVAKAQCLHATVVTLETFEPKSYARVPLPNICVDESVQYVNTFDFLRKMEAEFHFDPYRAKRSQISS